ncbi:MAG: hypothetical protein ACPHID_03615 [Thermoplasmatota archaeon]
MSFEPEHFKERILEHLLAQGADSISGIARALSHEREQPIHRLTVAGYLAAMTEMGVLREVARPPSKQYQVVNKNHHKDLYRRIGDAVRHVPMPQHQRGATALAALQRLLGRPVFRGELHYARIPVPEEMPKAQVSEEERRTYRTLVPQRWPRIDLPRGDPLLRAPADVGPVEEVIRRALLEATDATAYTFDAQPRGTQAALPLGES